MHRSSLRLRLLARAICRRPKRPILRRLRLRLIARYLTQDMIRDHFWFASVTA
jgi:hypothetical protein